MEATRTSLSIVESSRMLGPNKMLAHADRIAQWQSGKLPAPVTVELNLTDLCNHDCPGCSFGYLVNKSKASIPFDMAKKIVNQLATFGVRGLTFSGGGEPLTYGDDKVMDLMEQASRSGMKVGLITNGSLLTPNAKYYDSCQWIRVSLDAYSSWTFSRFHGRGEKEFLKVVERIELFGKVKPKDGVTFGVGFLTDRESVSRGDFMKMARFCSEINGLDYLQFRPLVENMVANPSLSGGYDGFSEIELRNINQAFAEASATYSRTNFKVLLSAEKYVALSQPGFGKVYDKCHGHFLQATIGADAKVYICCHGQGQAGFCLGDLRANTFDEIWYGEQARRVYESISPANTCPPACRLHNNNVFLHELKNGFTHKDFI